ncbi:MAG: GIY-YIG nuclease family protein [Rhodothermales bacterium]
MRTRPKTIQIFLPDGNARGIRLAEITSRTVQAIQIPRTKLAAAGEREEAKGVGVYFLFGEHDDEARPSVYIGEAEDCYQRLKQHVVGKSFWQQAVAITSKTQRFTKADVKYLEWYCYQHAIQVGRFTLENKAIPTKPYLPEPAIADLLDNFETIQVVVSTLGFPLFDTIKPPRKRDQFYCEGRGAKGIGELVEDGFLVLKGSTAAMEVTPSAKERFADNVRQRLLRSGILVPHEQLYRFAEDYLFKSPSGGAVAILGRSSNGWTAWKNAKGQTLDEVKRQG